MDVTSYLLGLIPPQYLIWLFIALVICSVLDEYLPQPTETSPVWWKTIRTIIASIDNIAKPVVAALKLILNKGAKPAASVVLLLLVAGGLVACTSTTGSGSTSVAWTPAQAEWFELNAATAAVKEAAALKNNPDLGLSPLVVAQIKAGMIATANAVQAQSALLGNGASVTSQIVGAVEGSSTSAINSLGSILAAQHGSDVNATAFAVAAGIDALGQIATLAPVYSQLKAGYQPTDADLQSAIAALNAAAAL